MIKDIDLLRKLLKLRLKSFKGHAGRRGRVGGSLPKGQTTSCQIQSPRQSPIMVPAKGKYTKAYVESLTPQQFDEILEKRRVADLTPRQRAVEWAEKTVPEFADYKSAEKWMSTVWQTKCSFQGISIGMLNKLCKTYSALATQFPATAEKITFLGTGPVPSDTETFATISPSGSKYDMTLNPHFFGDPEKFRRRLNECESTNFHPSGINSPEGVLTHEFGHVVELRMEDQDIYGSLESVRHFILDERADSDLSLYACSDISGKGQEGFAEAFAVHLLGTEKVRKHLYVVKLGSVLDDCKGML